VQGRLSAFAATLAVVSLGALAAAGSASAAPAGFFGLVPQGATPSGSDIERMGQGKVGSVRLLLNWTAIEPVDDDFNFETTDEYIGNLAAAGIRPLPFVWGVPPFVSSDNLQMPVATEGQKAQWAEFLRRVAGRYGAGGQFWNTVYPAQHPGSAPVPVETIQIWNEQNAPKHVLRPSPSGYAELLRISDQAIGAVDPGIEIALGGMFGRPTGTAVTGDSGQAAGKGGAIKAWTFIKKLYKTKGVKGFFDGVSLHPYSPDLKGIKDQVNKIRKVLKKKKDKKTDLWITELGWGSDKVGRLGVGAKKQPKLLKKSFKMLLRKRRKWKIPGVFWYTWRDVAGAPCDWCGSAGLFPATGLTPKPAWSRFVKFTGGS
jgi:hypothetical protein